MGEQHKLALALLLFVCGMFAVFLVVFAFFPSLYHLPLMGHSITLGIPVALFFILTIFSLMVYYVLRK